MRKITKHLINNKPQRRRGAKCMIINPLHLCASAVYSVRLLIPITLAAMIWSACSKSELPDGGFDSPVFFVGFEADSNMIADMTAGVDGKYLFTRVERGADNVLVMSGAFADASCPTGDCPGSVRFDFRNINTENTTEAASIFEEGTNWEYRPNNNQDTLQHFTVGIRWVTPNGSVLRSDLIPQPQTFDSSFFRILSSRDWELNERGETTWKMDIDFSCWLFDSIQSQQRKIMGSGVIAVGYR